MSITRVSRRQFNQDAGKAMKAAAAGPVFITDHGQPTHVLLTFEEHKRLTGERAKIADLLAMPGIADLDVGVRPPRDLARPADFS